ncbi:MAG TPA: recombinase family protein [Pyrinomonadaceae bacterium]|nr:recombinase family protein [Pyrinomonadaceae bacterium]
MQVFGYARTSTDEQTNGMESQVALLQQEAQRRGVAIEIRTEHGSAKSVNRRPVLRELLETLDKQGGMLIVPKLDRLVRSVINFCEIVERSRKHKWNLVVLDALDTESPQGELMAGMLAVFAQFERRLISARTKNGLAEVKKRGVQLGKPSQVPNTTINRILELQSQGHSLRRITSVLNDEKIPAPKGKVWHLTTVAEIVKRQKGK